MKYETVVMIALIVFAMAGESIADVIVSFIF